MHTLFQNLQKREKLHMYKFGRNKHDHSEKKYGPPLWLCTIENKDFIILVFASFPWHSRKITDGC
jgi:hypothetical protein